MSCGVGHRRGSDPEFLWLCHRPAAAAPIQPLAQEFPYATDAALKKKVPASAFDGQSESLLELYLQGVWEMQIGAFQPLPWRMLS